MQVPSTKRWPTVERDSLLVQTRGSSKVKPAPRTGAALSTKQLIRTVLDGRKVTFHLHGGLEVTGYLCGMDDFHWMVVTPGGEQYLIHKASAPLIDLSDSAKKYASEPSEVHRRLEKVVGPFRRYVEVEFFGRTGAPASDERAAS